MPHEDLVARLREAAAGRMRSGEGAPCPDTAALLVAASDELTRLGQELDSARRQLVTACDGHRAFTYAVSHDLRAPLRAIGGFAALLEEQHGQRLDDEARRFLGIIDANARLMSQQLDGLLELSRLGRAGLTRVPLDMTAIAREVAAEIRQREPERAVQITVQQLEPIAGDRAMVRRALRELVANGWKFSRNRPDAAIEIGSRREAGANVYFVRDNGVGFAAKYGDRLFKVFQRLHGGEEFEGIGVGLALVHAVVMRHGGQVWAEAGAESGATFAFNLPIEPVAECEGAAVGDVPDTANPAGPSLADRTLPECDMGAAGVQRGRP